MKKIYLDLKYTTAVDQAYRHDVDSLLGATGRNLGNLPFRHALRGLVDGLEDYEPLTWAELETLVGTNKASGPKDRGCAAKVKDVIISAANWLTDVSSGISTSHFTRFTEALERGDGNVVIFGLGAQVALGTDKMRLSHELKRFLQLLSERSAKISVRDVFTQRVLNDHGLHNVVVTGCPSNFINKDPNLGKKLRESAEALAGGVSSWADLRVAISELQHKRDQVEVLTSDLFVKLRDTPSFYILQEGPLLPMLLREFKQNVRLRAWQKLWRPQRQKFWQPRWKSIGKAYHGYTPSGMSGPEAFNVMRSKALHFSDVEAWLDFARTCDFSFGMRIHGTMIPLQAGVPAVLLAHDVRTHGLAEVMKIPHLTPADYLAEFQHKPRQFLRYCAESLEPYDQNRSQLAEVMTDYLQSNGLTPKPELQALIKA